MVESANKLGDAIRILSADAVEHAKSGHPGMPMGMADIAITLWKNHLKHNPTNPNWVNRDRFILSNGHGSMLLYSLLHLTGYNLKIEDIKNFRQLHSKTPGHPEYGVTPGVETTTGPLGQGLANGVGMALAEKLLAHEFNQPDVKIIDHHTYVFVGDGCLMEGISHEVCSFAGTLGLGKLIVLYDDNGISIDGKVENWYHEDVAMRFNAYNWHVITNIDGHNCQQINNAITQAKLELNKPSLIICKTKIGKGSPNKVGTEECHGAPLGIDEIVAVRKNLDWHYPPFEIPQEIYQALDFKKSGKQLEEEWNNLFVKYKEKYPKEAIEFERRIKHLLPSNFAKIILKGMDEVISKKENIASRKASQNAIEYFTKYLPEMLGGSADLTGSNLTNWSNAKTLAQVNNFTGNYISYGVREFGMAAIMNGLYLHGGFRPFGGTFLVFSDYARNAIRMASLMQIAPIFILTHDSIGLGEDGPTHQPIEQMASLRLIPNLVLWRPCDSVETFVAWGHALQSQTNPVSIVLSRQNLNFIERTHEVINNIKRGGYILKKTEGIIEILIVATGSEVGIAIGVYEKLISEGYQVQLVSMPSTSIFDQQEITYKNQVIPPQLPLKFAIEAGVSDSWYKYVGNNGVIFGIDKFGESGKASDLFAHFGLTINNVFDKIKKCLLNSN